MLLEGIISVITTQNWTMYKDFIFNGLLELLYLTVTRSF